MKRSKPQLASTASGAEVMKAAMRNMVGTAAGAVVVLGILILMSAPPAGIAEPIKKVTRMR